MPGSRAPRRRCPRSTSSAPPTWSPACVPRSRPPPAPRVVLVGSISGTQPVDQALVEALLAGDVDEAARLTEAALADGRPQQLYPSSKSALTQWARRTAVTPGWADAGIAINVVAPGVVLTQMTTDLFADPRMKQVMDAAVPMPLHGYAAPRTSPG